MTANATDCAPPEVKAAEPEPGGETTPAPGAAPVSLGRSVKRFLAHRAMRFFTLAYFVAMFFSRIVGAMRSRRPSRETCEILLTGTFYSENWLLAHVRPLAFSKRCSRLLLVTTYPVPDLPHLEAIYPPHWLQRIAGRVPSRMLTFAWVAIRRRPDIVGGFHLLLNGMFSTLLAPLAGARSMYFCVGGPAEVLDGGIHAENRLFGLMETPDAVVEKRLIRVVAAFDLVITMGTGAIEFFKSRGIDARYHVVSGGMDTSRFAPQSERRDIDLIMVGRLAAIKRIDLLLGAVQCVAQRLPDVNATIVGDGELRESLERLADKLGVSDRVTFAGQQSNVQEWLQRSKIFVLSSDSEGLALSMMEAMLCGLPAVVSNVGDLGDLVEDGVNGFLVNERTPEAFADRIVELLEDSSRYAAFSIAARERAMRYDLPAVQRQWDGILEEVIS